MAKQSFDDPLDVLNALDAPQAPKQPKKRKNTSQKKKTTFEDPLDALSPKQISRATKTKGMAGQYKRKTFLIHPGQLEYLYQIAEEQGMGVMETHRWLIDVAFEQYDQGVRPEVEVKTVRVQAKRKHWSGQTQ